MPLFSIIIPTYNSEKTLEEAIKSIMNQTFQDWEILIMDGLSTDNTLEIAHSFRDSRIKIFSQKDSGVYDAMNKGIEKAEGEWLYFLGSDDSLFNNDVLNLVSININLKDNANFFYGNTVFINSKGFQNHEFNIDTLLQGNICHQGIFYGKKVFQYVGVFDLEYKIWSDYDFNIRCFLNENVISKHIPVTIANFNDGVGLSKDIDSVFQKKLQILKQLKSLSLKEFKKNSKEYQLGAKLYHYFSKLKKT